MITFNIVCPFCNNINISEKNMWDSFRCENHKIPVIITYVRQKLRHIDLEHKDYLITIYHDHISIQDNYLSYKLKGQIINIPLDPNLTPENIDTKLKTYLTFQ